MKEDFSKYNPEGSVLRKVQLRLLDMLIAVDTICRKNEIPYWIEYGTLLGAVRHGGFIPWDDDIDIAVMEKDYKRLRCALIKELPEQFVFQDTTTDPYAFFYYGRVRDTKSYCYYPRFAKLKQQGLWLDIFRYTPYVSHRFRNLVDFLFRRAYHEKNHYGDVEYNSSIRKSVNKVIAYMIYPFTWAAKEFIEWLGKKTNSQQLTRWDSHPRAIYKASNIFPLKEIEFEGHMFLAPGNWHEHLTGIYGDYMKVPPPEKREQILDMNFVKFY